MTVTMSFHAEKCCHLVSGHAAYARRICSIVHSYSEGCQEHAMIGYCHKPYYRAMSMSMSILNHGQKTTGQKTTENANPG